jgi:hypothetical protein
MVICYEGLTIKMKDMLNLPSSSLKNADPYVTRWLIRFKFLGRIIIKRKLNRFIHGGDCGNDIFFLNFNQYAKERNGCNYHHLEIRLVMKSDETCSHSRRRSTGSLITDYFCYRAREIPR